MIVLMIVYIILYYYKKNWMTIPVVTLVAFVIPKLFGAGYVMTSVDTQWNLNPFYWWNDMWGIGFGLEMSTILQTIPFACFVILLWTIDTLSIQTIGEASYEKHEEKVSLDMEQSFVIVSIRNIIGSFFGGAQTASLWRSFLIPLYMVKRPMRSCALLLGIVGMIASLTVIPIQIMSYTPLVWSVLLFGIFMPFTVTALSNMKQEKKRSTKIFIFIFATLGILINPMIAWITSILYEKIEKKRE